MHIKQAPAVIRIAEGTTISPIELSQFIEHDPASTLLYICDETLPAGLQFNLEQASIEGTPSIGSAQKNHYEFTVQVSDGTESLSLPIRLLIYKTLSADEIESLRHQTWQNLSEQAPLTDELLAIIERPISKNDIFYLLERYASFTVWNADDLRLADKGKPITIPGASQHFLIFDFEVCIVATPKDLYSFKRTLSDATQTARAMIKEAYKRKWHVEFGGYDRMANAAWYEARQLNLSGEHQMEVRNYEPPAIKQINDKNSSLTS